MICELVGIEKIERHSTTERTTFHPTDAVAARDPCRSCCSIPVIAVVVVQHRRSGKERQVFCSYNETGRESHRPLSHLTCGGETVAQYDLRQVPRAQSIEPRIVKVCAVVERSRALCNRRQCCGRTTVCVVGVSCERRDRSRKGKQKERLKSSKVGRVRCDVRERMPSSSWCHIMYKTFIAIFTTSRVAHALL